MNEWQLQEAKARLSELVKNALTEGPQHISLRGEPAVVVISEVEYKNLSAQKPSFVRFMQKSPLRGLSLKIKRNKSLPRDIDL